MTIMPLASFCKKKLEKQENPYGLGGGGDTAPLDLQKFGINCNNLCMEKKIRRCEGLFCPQNRLTDRFISKNYFPQDQYRMC
jgi:hypothetical protein